MLFCLSAESIYCEPQEVAPYATSEDSDKDSVGSSHGRRRGRPENWRGRQSIPLPPKPDETGLRTSPPPPYYPTRPLPPPVPAPRLHGYVNDDPASCYFQPLSDEEAQLVQPTQAADNPAFEAENVYLEGRRDDDLEEAIELRNLGASAATQNTDPVAATERRNIAVATWRSICELAIFSHH